MVTLDLERIRFTTEHFNDLQGLRLAVPMGLITLGCAGPEAVRAVCFLAALFLMVGAKRFYRNAFGAVEQQPDDFTALSVYSPAGPVPQLAVAQPAIPFARPFLMTVTLALTVFTYFQALPPNVVVAGEGPLSQHPRVFREPTPLYGPPWIPPRIDLLLPALVYPRLALLVCGSALVLAGVLDHWQLVRALGRPQS